MEQEPGRKQIIGYLLGKLPSEDCRRIEEIYFFNDRLFDEMLVVEESLIDSYVRGNLSDEDRKLFEANYLSSPKRKEQVEFARSFLEALPIVAGSSPGHSPGVRPGLARVHVWAELRERYRALVWGLIAVAALLLAGFSYLLYRVAWLHDSPEQVREQRAKMARQEQEIDQVRGDLERQREELRDKIARVQSLQSDGGVTPTGGVVIKPLLAVQVRGEQQVQVLNVPSTALVLLLQVPVGEVAGKTYQAILAGDDAQILTYNGPSVVGKASGNILEIPVPAIALNKRQYVLTIKTVPGGEDVGIILFEVKKS